MSKERQRAGSPPTRTDLEERLAGANAAAERLAILDRLADIELRLRGSIAGGLARPQFTAWQQALAAVAAAGAVMHHLPPVSTGTSPSTIEGLFRR